MVVVIIGMELYIKRDVISAETPQQVWQWTSSVSVVLVSLSAAVLRLRFLLASERELKDEIAKKTDWER